MNFDKLLKIFVPTDHAFFPMFRDSASNLVKTAHLLKAQMNASGLDEKERINREIKNYEHIGDEITNHTFEQLNKSFITPFDREDIHELTGNIDDVVDSINSISRRICLYKLDSVAPIFVEMADLIISAAKEIELCVSHLEHAASKRNEIIGACKRVKDIEHKADELYLDGIANIFENEQDTKAVITNSKILENLERCVDEAEDVTDTIQTILIKMA